MSAVKILSWLTRLITASTGLIFVLIILMAAGYETTDGPFVQDKNDPPPQELKTAFESDPGYKLFKGWGCKTCHRVNEKLIGPALAGVTERREKDWIYRFVQNSSKLIAEKDPTAVALYKEYKVEMPQHDLKKEEIDLILEYVKKATK